MISIIEHIEYLVLRHDCVVVPGIGALIAHHTPAYIDEELECIFPPRRSMAFNPELTHNDGLLASSVARRHGITYDQAVQVVADCVNAMRYQMRQEGETGIGHLGVLTLSENGIPVFEPFEATCIDPRSAGLTAVKATPLPAAGANADMLSDTNGSEAGDDVYQEYRPPLHRRMLQAVAAIATLIMLGIMLSTPTIDHRAMRASMAPYISSPAVSHLDEPGTLDINTADLVLSIAIPDSTIGSGIARPYRPASADGSIRCNPADPYFLVVASLLSRNKADEYIASHPRGHEMHILESDSRYRIYVSTARTAAPLRELILSADFASHYPSAWVCRP